MSTAVPNSSQLSQFLREYCVSGVSVGVATVCTNPIGSPHMFMQTNMLYEHYVHAEELCGHDCHGRRPQSSSALTVLGRCADVVKVRLQLQELQAGRRLLGGLPPNGMVSRHCNAGSTCCAVRQRQCQVHSGRVRGHAVC